MMASDPITDGSALFLVADWLTARYPFDNLADQLHVSPDRLEAMLGNLLPEPDPAPISEPTSETSEFEDSFSASC
jgi:hypothetical protein